MTTYNYNFETKTNIYNFLHSILPDVEFVLQIAVEKANKEFGISEEYVLANIGTPVNTPNGEIIIKSPESFTSETSIYKQMDIHTLLKYLYYGGNRLEKGRNRDCYCNDQTFFLHYLGIPYRYDITDGERKLFAECLSDDFKVLLDLCKHDSEDDDFYTAKNAIACIEAMMSIISSIESKLGEDDQYYSAILSVLNAARFGAVDADAEDQISKRIAEDNSSKSDELSEEQIIGFETEKYFETLDCSDEFEAGFAKTAASLYYQGLESLKNHEYEQAASLFVGAMDMYDCSPACYELAKCYQNGLGVRKDVKRAFELFEEASKDYAPANFALAETYHYGLGVEKNFAKAEAYYFKSCTNTEIGFIALANTYIYGIGVPKDEAKGLEIFKKAILWCEERLGMELHYTQMHKSIISNLSLCVGDCYYYGIGCEKDIEVAEHWYRKATNFGNADAAYILASIYYDGREVEQNDKIAESLLKLSAKLGSKSAKRLCVISEYDGNKDPDEFLSYCRPELEWLNSMEYGNDLMLLCKLAEIYENYGFDERSREIYYKALIEGSARAARVFKKA